MVKTSENKRKYMILPFLAGAMLFLSGCVDQAYDAPLVKPPQFSGVRPSADEIAPQAVFPSGKPIPPPKKKNEKLVRTSSEALLSAEGNWNLVEETSSNDPALAHQRARDKVDPRRRSVMSELAPHFTPGAKSGQDGKMRVLKLQPNSDGTTGGVNLDEGFEVAETSISKPTHKVVKPEIANKIKQLFGGEAVESSVDSDLAEGNRVEPEIQNHEMQNIVNPVMTKTVPLKTKKMGGFFDKVVSAFSSDELVAEEAQLQTQKRTEPVPTDMGAQDRKSVRVSSTGVVVPPAPPDRKREDVKTSVIVASQSAAVTSDAGAQEVIAVENAPQKGQVHTIGMRVAMHPSKTRLAFDLSGAVKYKVAIDHIRNVLRIKFEKTSWDQGEQGSLEESSKLLGSYVVRKQTDGSVIFEVRLREKTAIQDTMILRPGISPHHRVVVDIKSVK